MTARATTSPIARMFLAARLRSRHTQTSIARRAGITASYLSRIERGKINPSLEMALRLAEALRMPLGAILEADHPRRKLGACPVTASGRCLMDLIDTGGKPGPAMEIEQYTPRQLRMLRGFARLLLQVDEDLLSAFEILIRKNLKGEAGDSQEHG